MIEIAAREVQARDLWQSIPLEFAMSSVAILLAGGLKFVGWLP